MRIYLDSNVFISFVKRENGRRVFSLGLQADLFFDNAKNEKNTLVLSELFFKEVKKTISLEPDEILNTLNEIGVFFETVEIRHEMVIELEKKGIHYPDSLHASTAILNGCDCIATFNKKDFEKINERIEIISPSEFT